MSPSPLALLEEPEAYVSQLARLRDKYGRMRRLDALQHRGVSLADLGMQDTELGGLLAWTVANGAYRFGPVALRRALVGGKWRQLCRSNLVDTVVLGVVAQVLAGLAEPFLSPRVYSYRSGRSSWEALSDLNVYMREHRAVRPDVRQRGLYVLHRDVRTYGESIRTDDDSALWLELDAMFDRARVHHSHTIRRLARTAMRPRVEGYEEAPPPRIGVPTGSPVQPVACNLYLASVDRQLDRVPGSFYARFGDDMLFCHPDAAVARRVSEEVDAAVVALGLEVKAEKRKNYYLTGAGCPSVAWPESQPTSEIDHLGYRVALGGRVGLKAEKGRRLLRELRVRAHAAASAMRSAQGGRSASAESRARVVSAVIARALDPASALCDPAAGVLRYVVTDRRQLAHLDHAVALIVAEAASGRRGPRAFRDVPYRFLRREAGLPSLVMARNNPSGSREAP